jgi:DNA polymerase-4
MTDADDGGARCRGCASPRLVHHAELLTLSIAHLDCDAFYAAVEKRDRPEIGDRPVIVGGGARGVVTTCCYLARTYGVRSAMPMFKALKACPEAIVIRPDFAAYSRESRRIMSMLRSLTPLVQPLSLDEAWLDLSGTERLNGAPPAVVLAKLQARIEAETGLTVSIGLAPNKLLAKIASDLDKPRGFSVIGSSDAAEALAPLSAGVLPGVGPALLKRLGGMGVVKVADLQRLGPAALERRLGPEGAALGRRAFGLDARPVTANEGRKSISAETTFDRDIADQETLTGRLWPLCEKVAAQARTADLCGRTVTLKLKTARFEQRTRRRTLSAGVQTASGLFKGAQSLLEDAMADGGPFRLIGVGLGNLELTSGAGALFDDGELRSRTAEAAVDRLRARFGDDVVVRGRTLRAP